LRDLARALKVPMTRLKIFLERVVWIP